MSRKAALGIWMDHMDAHLIEWTTPILETKTISSAFTHQVKEHSLGEGERVMHNKEQHEQAAYYKHLGEVIRNYTEVLLFGPSEAKTELFNLLKSDTRFSEIRFQIRHTDKMTENQQHAFVKGHFSKRIF
ncbi:MAG: hypothetical protein ACHQRM_03795 [Bacteroidia bacterium]